MAGLRQAFALADCEAMAVVSGVGSLSAVRLRYAGRDEAVTLQGPFEILSLTGTLDPGHQHLHVSIGDAAGRVLGGHLLADGAVIHTTAEIVLLALPELRFGREDCPASGYRELVIRPAVG